MVSDEQSTTSPVGTGTTETTVVPVGTTVTTPASPSGQVTTVVVGELQRAVVMTCCIDSG